jgi:homoserine O-acetyltransferase
MNSIIRVFAVLLSILVASFASAADYPAPTEGDYTIRDFKFASGETLPELRLHYRTLGKPEKDAQRKTTNAVLIMHGTTGSGAQFIRPEFAGKLFGKDQPWMRRFFVILPDDRHATEYERRHARKFPRYDTATWWKRISPYERTGREPRAPCDGHVDGRMHTAAGELHPDL